MRKLRNPGQFQRFWRGRPISSTGIVWSFKKAQVRLFGVDAPELSYPFGETAKGALVNLRKGNVRAEVMQVDGRGRKVARCYLPDGRDVSAEMVKAGLALDWPKFSDGEYRDLETPEARKKLWLVDARQKGRMDVWKSMRPVRKHRRRITKV